MSTEARSLFCRRSLAVSATSACVAVIAAGVAKALITLICFFTGLFWYGRLGLGEASPSGHSMGAWGILIPAVGGTIVGCMARYGSKAIRGHGIPEAMEQILINESKIPARIAWLKPLSAAIAIGSGGPFGAEGPIIATGGALGSLVGQWLPVTAKERRVLLASGAAAGMTAIFGTPLAAVLLAIELLLFEFKPRSYVPVCVATVVAAGIRPWIFGPGPMFHMPEVGGVSLAGVGVYGVEGLVIGACAVGMTRLLYWIEDVFERLPVHWMWWPTIGGLVVGLCGWWSPRTLGVGYENIEGLLNGRMLGAELTFFAFLKFVSWSIALGSGTSGGTLAPLLTIGGALGVICGSAWGTALPHSVIDVRVAALVGMAACFAGASRALFASIVFAAEVTQQQGALLPLIAGCSASYVISALLMEQTIMTEKLARRGHHVPVEYEASVSR